MSILSDDGKTWSTKLARIGNLSRENKEVQFNNLGHLIDLPFLLECFRRLDGDRAIGTDGITKELYEADLIQNLSDLLMRIRRGTYRPSAARLVEIPKEDGGVRPLAISCFEDKIVQLATSKILESVYEPLFLDCSYGYRPNRSAHHAIKALNQAMFKTWNGALIEIDLSRYFNSVPHRQLMDLIGKKISDKRFLALIATLIRTPLMLKNGTIEEQNIGVPQGSVISPILANLYLHFVLDEWFAELKAKHFRDRKCEMIRYADDIVFVFNFAEEAVKLAKVLPKRLAKFGLEMNFAKSSYQRCGHEIVGKIAASKSNFPAMNFLGFRVSWKKMSNGRYRPWARPRSDRTASTLKRIRKYLKDQLNCKNHLTVLKKVSQVLNGWVNYFSVSDCEPYINIFIDKVRVMLHRWFNRRGKKGAMNWARLDRILEMVRIKKGFKTKSLFTAGNC